MTSPVYKNQKKQDSYNQLVKRNRILLRKLRDTNYQLSQRIDKLEVERDFYKKQVEFLSGQRDPII